MAVRTIGCGACGAVVPYGRLSCPECGELLASVAGAVRRPRLVDPETVEAADPELDGAAADGAADDLAKAGFDSDQIMQSLNHTLNLVAAGQLVFGMDHASYRLMDYD